MIITENKSPLYLKLSVTAIGLVAFFFILSVGQDIIVPLIFSTIIAILLNPFVNFLIRWRINRVFAIFLAVTAAIIIIVALAYFIFSQAALLSQTLPQFKQKFLALINDLIDWISANLNVSEPKIQDWINQTKSEGLNNSTAYIGTALTTAGGFLILFFLLPVYIFLILF